MNESKDELLARIDASWRELTDVIDGLDTAALTAVSGDGWSVKDHLAHVATWERSAVALLRGQDRAAEIGIADLPDDATEEAINEAIRRQHRDEPADEVLRLLHGTHADLLAVLAPMSDADLQRPYSDYQPGVSGPNSDVPVVRWVVGNTIDHFGEHVAWIRELRAATATGRPG